MSNADSDAELELRVAGIVSAAFGVDSAAVLREGFALKDADAYSSFALLELVLRLEEEFQISILDEDLDLDHFRTPSSITQFVRQRHRPTSSE